MLSKKNTRMYAVVAYKSTESFGCMSMPFGCMSMDRLDACVRLLGASMRRRLGAKYMPSGCISLPFGCMFMDRLGACMRLLCASMRKSLGACMRLLGASFITAESLPDSR